MERARRDPKVLVIGGGFSGIGMAIRLEQSGITDFTVLERASGLGGAWHHNTYPGCRCDVPSHLYSFSFAPNPGWSDTYAAQPEIRDYLSRCARDFGVRERIRTGTEVRSAAWNADARRWQLDTGDGPYTAQLLVAAMGPLSEPLLPDVPGIESFEGATMHSARWDHTYELRGRTVASIGTGASAVQYVPEIARQAERLYVFQRTAPWVVPRSVRALGERERRLYGRHPAAQRLVRSGVYLSREAMVLGFVHRPGALGLLERLSRSHMRRQIADPDLLARVTPDHALGCKRILPSNGWYRALQRPNVELVDGGLRALTRDSVVDAAGRRRRVDAIVFGTGFHVTDAAVGGIVRGGDGRLLAETWRGSPRAYMGSAVPGFPNLFLLLGPNTGLGHSSMVYMLESQIEHVLGAIAAMDRAGAATVEVRREAHDAYNRRVDERMRGTVWASGCASFYQDGTGRNSVLWPDWTWRFRRLAARFDADAYALGAPLPAAVAA